MEQQILKILPRTLQAIVQAEQLDFRFLQEIRLRTGQPITVLYKGEEVLLPRRLESKHKVLQEEIRETVEYICNYSLYAYENELRQGFVTVEGGHRIGLAGQVILEN